jgi:hypothetical protein
VSCGDGDRSEQVIGAIYGLSPTLDCRCPVWVVRIREHKIPGLRLLHLYGNSLDRVRGCSGVDDPGNSFYSVHDESSVSFTRFGSLRGRLVAR